MPYFKWVGVDISGNIKKGKQPASSSQNLKASLLQQGIALLHSKSLYAPTFLWSINAQVKGNLFAQKAKLLKAGLLLPRVIDVIAQQSSNPLMCDILSDINQDLQRGVFFAQALEKHIHLSDPIVIVMLKAGHESGNMVNAIENIALYFHNQYIFKKNLRSVLAMPFLTLLFFLGISFFIFAFIIPRFAEMFDSLQQELPALTQSMIKISNFISSSYMLYVVIIIGVIILSMHYYFITKRGKKTWDYFIEHVPFINSLLWQHYMGQALHAIALLINSGVPLVNALKIVSENIGYEKVAIQLQNIHGEVDAGKLLSNAMLTLSIFLPEAVALVSIGQESGALGNSLESVALIYSDKVDESLRRFIFFLQPMVIIFLGLLITMLIFAIYSPIMQLSYVV
jgi:type IV pilus assembly protein PilC